MKTIPTIFCGLLISICSLASAPQIIEHKGETIGSIQLSDSGPIAKLGKTTYTCSSASAAKAEYKKDGTTVARVKRSDSSIKFYDGQGTFKWKLRLYDDKFKISDNEENKDAWQIKEKGEKQKGYKPDDSEAFQIRYKSGNCVIELTDNTVWKMQSPKLSGAVGIFAMSHIPKETQLIIAAELLRLKR